MFVDQRANVNVEIISLCYTRYEPIILQTHQCSIRWMSYHIIVLSLYKFEFTCVAALPVFVSMCYLTAEYCVVCALPYLLYCCNVIITNTVAAYRKYIIRKKKKSTTHTHAQHTKHPYSFVNNIKYVWLYSR